MRVGCLLQPCRRGALLLLRARRRRVGRRRGSDGRQALAQQAHQVLVLLLVVAASALKGDQARRLARERLALAAGRGACGGRERRHAGALRRRGRHGCGAEGRGGGWREGACWRRQPRGFARGQGRRGTRCAGLSLLLAAWLGGHGGGLRGSCARESMSGGVSGVVKAGRRSGKAATPRASPVRPPDPRRRPQPRRTACSRRTAAVWARRCRCRALEAQSLWPLFGACGVNGDPVSCG